MKRIFCTLAVIVLTLSFYNIYNLVHASNNLASSNYYLSLVNDDEQNNSEDNSSSENSNDHTYNGDSTQNNNEDDDNSSANENESDTTHEPDKDNSEVPPSESDTISDQTDVKDPEDSDDSSNSGSITNEEISDEVTDSPATNVNQESTETNNSDTTVANPSQNNTVNNTEQTNNTVPVQEKFYLINTLNKENMWANKTVYLTFDDGPSEITEQVLDILKENNIKATFFVVGNKTETGKSLLKRIDNEGHSIGNHTYSHDYKYIYKHVDNFFNDLYKNDKMIYEATGKHTKIIRFPGGSNNSSTKTENGKEVMNKIMDRLVDEGYVYFDWNASSGDASPQPATVDQIVNNVLTWVGKNNNAIVLFHDTRTKVNTLKALPIIVKKLKFLGCKFDTLSENSYQVSFTKRHHRKPKVSDRKPPYVIKKLKKLEARYNTY
ncbi:polysaccharide deacetylase family protein [Brassicibacter mesophilus]|uniref:polysaccharide deacetylase family protein n=1 Tax=Brassicibacter mesophilus TaxID=745119 RepID=UPI003D1B9E9F